MLYTKRGDSGTTTLYGTSLRLAKSDAIFDALGAVDELNAHVGLCRALSSDTDGQALLFELQEGLFVLQAELAGAPQAVSSERLSSLEDQLAAIEVQVENPRGFVIPGTTPESAYYDVARAVARRAERALWRAPGCVGGPAYAFINRVSSVLYALARRSGQRVGEAHPQY